LFPAGKLFFCQDWDLPDDNVKGKAVDEVVLLGSGAKSGIRGALP